MAKDHAAQAVALRDAAVREHLKAMLAPSLWGYETANGLTVAVRRGHIDAVPAGRIAVDVRLADPVPADAYREANQGFSKILPIQTGSGGRRWGDTPRSPPAGGFCPLHPPISQNIEKPCPGAVGRGFCMSDPMPIRSGGPGLNGGGLPPIFPFTPSLYASSASSRRPGIGQITIRLASTSISRTTSRMAGIRTSPKGPRTTYTSLARV